MGAFVIEHVVPWPDVDMAGIVYFARFLSYFELAELEWVRSHGFRYDEFLRHHDVLLPRVSVRCDYRAPARLDDRIAIEMRLARLGRSSFTFGYEAFRLPDRLRLAEGAVTIAAVSPTRFRPVRIPEGLRAMLEELGATGGDGERSQRTREP